MDKKYNVVVRSKNGLFSEIMNEKPLRIDRAELMQSVIGTRIDRSKYTVSIEVAQEGFINTLS